MLKVLRGPEASMESSRGFYMGQQVATYRCKHPCSTIRAKSLTLHEIHLKTLDIFDDL